MTFTLESIQHVLLKRPGPFLFVPLQARKKREILVCPSRRLESPRAVITTRRAVIPSHSYHVSNVYKIHGRVYNVQPRYTYVWHRPKACAPDKATISWSSNPIRLKMVRKCAASLGSAPGGPLSALGSRPSGVTAVASNASTRPELHGIVGPPIVLIATTYNFEMKKYGVSYTFITESHDIACSKIALTST